MDILTGNELMSGATVYLDTPDGAPLGTTPLTAIRIPSGSHTLIGVKVSPW